MPLFFLVCTCIYLSFYGGTVYARYMKIPYMHISYNIWDDAKDDIVFTMQEILQQNGIEYEMRDDFFRKEKLLCVKMKDFHLVRKLVDEYSASNV